MTLNLKSLLFISINFWQLHTPKAGQNQLVFCAKKTEKGKKKQENWGKNLSFSFHPYAGRRFYSQKKTRFHRQKHILRYKRCETQPLFNAWVLTKKLLNFPSIFLLFCTKYVEKADFNQRLEYTTTNFWRAPKEYLWHLYLFHYSRVVFKNI